MKRIFFLFVSVLLFTSCNSIKRNQNLIDKGDYNEAIHVAVKKLEKDKTSTKSDAHIVLLEEAYKKAVEKDKKSIQFYKKQQNPAEAKNTYYKYVGLINRQETIQKLLPLYSTSLQRNATFKMENYSGKFAIAKQNYSNYLYDMGLTYMKFQNTLDYRKAYDSFDELSEVHPSFKDSYSLLDEAHFLGTDFVLVHLINRTYHIIPRDLERDLLSFNTYGLDDFWTVFHSVPEENIDYNFGIDLFFESIEFSPERVSEEEIKLEKEIKDGWEYQKDRNGNFVLDEDGNKIKKDIYITVKATLYQTIQTKSVQVTGNVIYQDFIKSREINHFPLISEFIFENVYGNYRGDKRALSPEDLQITKNKFLYFPSNEQMLFDAGEDIKLQLTEILKENSIR